MFELHLPWLELAVLTPLVGAMLTCRLRDSETARMRTLFVTGLTLILTVGAWEDFTTLDAFEAHDHWNFLPAGLSNALVIDELSAPLLPLAALLFFLTTLATLRTKMRRFPFAWNLLSLSMVLAMLCCRDPWGIITLLALQTVPPAVELYSRRRSSRVFLLHMGLSIGLLVAGWSLIDGEGPSDAHSILAVGMLIAAVLIRSGAVPVHCWMTDLFENATLGTSLLFVTPMAGAYATVRLVLPVAPDWALRTIAIVSLVTAVYAAGMALVQREARRFFVYLFLSHSSLVLIGLEVATPVGLSGGLCVWLSVGLSLAGFGITLRALEGRTGRLSLADYHGLYEHMPALAVFFLLTGLASIGFPGTIGFVGMELLVEGAVEVYPLVGVLLVLTAALNGIAILHAYFRLFTGTQHTASISLNARLSEKAAVLTLTLLILGGGLLPQPGVQSRYHAATEIMLRRLVNVKNGVPTQPQVLEKESPNDAGSDIVIDVLRGLHPRNLLIDPGGALSFIDLSDSAADDEILRLLRGQSKLSYLNFSNTSITDAGLASLGDLPQLKWLSFHNTQIGDDGLKHIARHKNLKSINLAYTEVTDGGIQYLAMLKKLHTINASNTAISDKSAESLTQLSELQRLQLAHTDVTDQGVSSIARITTLTHLDLSGTDVSDDGILMLTSLKELALLVLQRSHCTLQGIEKLQSALPECEIVTSPDVDASARFAFHQHIGKWWNLLTTRSYQNVIRSK